MLLELLPLIARQLAAYVVVNQLLLERQAFLEVLRVVQEALLDGFGFARGQLSEEVTDHQGFITGPLLHVHVFPSRVKNAAVSFPSSAAGILQRIVGASSSP